MKNLSQESAPILEALEKMKRLRLVPFDVPGHKRGRGNPELTEFLGEKCLSVDVNSMKMLDNLCHPVSVIREAEQLAAEAFGAAHAFFMIGGTTSAVQTMILTACKRGDKIIMPRNVHRSAINALILCGATPIYIDPEMDKSLGISLGMSYRAVEEAVKANPDAKAILVNNPTYYGICSNVEALAKLAHEHGMLLLADEAHGTHFYFHDKLPAGAMTVGADMAALSMHKSGGSLTQSSMLLIGPNVSEGYVHQIINLTQTTSGSYLLMASLDISRRNLALNGYNSFEKVTKMAQYAREEINDIGGYYAYGNELKNGGSIFDFDETKLVVNTRSIGLTGIEVYDLLRDEYDIQMEFGDLSNVMAYISIGDRLQDIERLAGALADIRRLYAKPEQSFFSAEYVTPIVKATPQEAFYAEKEQLPIDNCVGRISAESVMCYPPGIPILSPGEVITADILDYIKTAREKGCSMQGPESEDISELFVLK
jgi:arginine/lysine/ornithine decarboxylase